MILSDGTIRKLIESGEIGVEPYDPSMIQPASIDVRLGKDFLTYRSGSHLATIDPARKDGSTASVMSYEHVVCGDDHPEFIVFPNAFVLATTLETIRVPNNLLARLEGKSSLGRIGLQVHITAGYIDPGFIGEVTLELYNVTNRPIVLVPGMKIGQICFEQMDAPAERPYGSSGLGSHYQAQRGATPPDFCLRQQ